jgi:hypothetical protein
VRGLEFQFAEHLFKIQSPRHATELAINLERGSLGPGGAQVFHESLHIEESVVLALADPSNNGPRLSGLPLERHFDETHSILYR